MSTISCILNSKISLQIQCFGMNHLKAGEKICSNYRNGNKKTRNGVSSNQRDGFSNYFWLYGHCKWIEEKGNDDNGRVLLQIVLLRTALISRKLIRWSTIFTSKGFWTSQNFTTWFWYRFFLERRDEIINIFEKYGYERVLWFLQQLLSEQGPPLEK